MPVDKTTLLWAPDHNRIARNEEADVCVMQTAVPPDQSRSPLPVHYWVRLLRSAEQRRYTPRLPGHLHEARRRAPLPPMSWSHPFLKVNANKRDSTLKFCHHHRKCEHWHCTAFQKPYLPLCSLGWAGQLTLQNSNF